ncbi:MAG TPA: hypothetical protein PLF79_17095, partial [Thauera sp.]|nr:hypothetical protein [Thauera sp.]
MGPVIVPTDYRNLAPAPRSALSGHDALVRSDYAASPAAAYRRRNAVNLEPGATVVTKEIIITPAGLSALL